MRKQGRGKGEGKGAPPGAGRAAAEAGRDVVPSRERKGPKAVSTEARNALAGERSPFLRHGATQPVDWLPWGEAAFERARREGRPILLDIGAVWCHWCHVMDRESYEDEETARLINELFVPVKVDRDERPDVDARYQRAVQALTGQGGWPLTAFLTPDGEVFYGGTYFPPEDRYGRPSFRRVLREVARVWRESPERAAENARAVKARLAAYGRAESEPGAVSPRLIDAAVEELASSFDFRYGGFGGAPKFPSAGALELLLDRSQEGGEPWVRRMAVETLDAMARGGIHDQLGGGFHRYATDARWRIPHFEKMAYDNGPLLAVYARAAAVYGSPLYREVAERVVAYYREVAPALLERGGFPASQDADVGPDDDGSYWTWTMDEARAALGGDERLLRAAVLRYGLDDPESAMHGDRERHVPYRALEAPEIAARLELPIAETESLLGEVERRLKAARDRRPRPFVDETPYAGWVSLVASGHLAAARYAGVEGAQEAALRALDRVWAEAFDEGRGVAHAVGERSGEGYLEDQAYAARAFIDAFELTQRPAWLERARRVLDVMLARFRDDGGALLDRARDAAGAVGALAEPHRPVVDAPAPAGNAVAALALLRLAALTHEERWREAALGVLNAFGGTAQRVGAAAASFVWAVSWATLPVTTVVVVGAPGDARADALLRAALAAPRPRTVVRRLAPDAVGREALPPALAAMVTREAPRAYVCTGETCAPPVAGVEALREVMG